MFRHYNLTRNQQSRDNYQLSIPKSDTKVLLYGRRDKISIQTNRHSIYIRTVRLEHWSAIGVADLRLHIAKLY